MKNSNFSFRALLAVAAVLFTFATANASVIGNENGTLPVDVKCVGTTNSNPVYQLTFSNTEVEEFQITIKDRYSVLHTEIVKGEGKSLVRKFQFVNEDGTNEDLITIEVKNLKNNNVVKYSIHANDAVAYEKTLVAAN